MRRFELVDGSSSKFWEIETDGGGVSVRFGKLGTAGQTKVKDHGTPAAAAAETDKLVREKTKKGYVEVTAGVAASGPDEIALVREHGQELLDAFGELTLLAAGETAAIVGSFVASPVGALWARVFEQVTWIGDEADGGAVGFWTAGGRRASLYVDNEGQVTLTGTSLLDHFAFKLGWSGADYEEEERAKLNAFVEAHGLPAIRSKKEREESVAGIETPSQRFEALRTPPPETKKAAAKKSTAKKVEKTPRPLATNVAACTLSSGHVLVVTGDDFAVEPLRKGNTYRFDPETAVAELLTPLDTVEYNPANLLALADDRALLLEPWALYENGAWRAAPGTALPPTSTHAQMSALGDGSHVVFGRSEGVLAHRVRADGTVQAIGDLPEPRSYDRMVRLPDGRLWFGGGEAQGERWFGATARTVILDPATWTFTAGPDLPAPAFRSAFFAGANGSAILLGRGAHDVTTLWSWDGERWSEGRPVPELPDGVSDSYLLADGTILITRWRDGGLVTIDPATTEVRVAGATKLGQVGARVHELGANRVLFVGGSLFGNKDAEPEIWNRSTGEHTVLPGREKDAERQAKALATYREKSALEAARNRAMLAEQAAARAAKA